MVSQGHGAAEGFVCLIVTETLGAGSWSWCWVMVLGHGAWDGFSCLIDTLSTAILFPSL
jgi:hypothetical protein